MIRRRQRVPAWALHAYMGHGPRGDPRTCPRRGLAGRGDHRDREHRDRPARPRAGRLASKSAGNTAARGCARARVLITHPHNAQPIDRRTSNANRGQAADHEAVTEIQRAMWASGDFHQIAARTSSWRKRFARPPIPTPGSACSTWRAGAGPRRWSQRGVLRGDRHRLRTGADRAREAAGNGPRRWSSSWSGNAQALPFADASFDVVLSVNGVQFAPDQKQAASERMRVCRQAHLDWIEEVERELGGPRPPRVGRDGGDAA